MVKDGTTQQEKKGHRHSITANIKMIVMFILKDRTEWLVEETKMRNGRKRLWSPP
jgi:hypothetical protein